MTTQDPSLPEEQAETNIAEVQTGEAGPAITTDTAPEIIADKEDTATVDITPTEVKEIEDHFRVFLQNYTLGALADLLEKRKEFLGKDEYEASIVTDNSYDNVLALAVRGYSVEAERVLGSIAAIEDKSLFDSKLIQDGKTILNSIVQPRRPAGKGQTLEGAAARAEFAIKTGRAKRIPLYNSGFHLDIKTPSLAALNDFYTEAFSTTNEYGREFGSTFFYFNDLLIKEALVKLIVPLVMGSSLRNWNRGVTLLRNLKLNDLKVILNGLGVLMFPDGFKFTHVCTNPNKKCTHHEELLIDISKFFRTNYMKLSDANIEHMKRHEEAPYEKIVEYQKNLQFNKSLRYGNIEFELRVPSVEDYLSYGRLFNANLIKENFADRNTNINNSLMFSYYQIFTPYIQTVTLYAADGTKDVVTSDFGTISDQLAQLQIDDTETKFAQDMDEYISATELTQLCYPAITCPKCGHEPKDNGGYHAVDPVHTFFTLSLKKLTLT